MPKKTPKTPNNKDYWESIFQEIDMDFIPIEYVNTLVVTFDDKTVWEIDMTDRDIDEDPESTLEDFFEEYEDTIMSLDFRLDLERIKKDISKRTSRFLKLNK